MKVAAAVAVLAAACGDNRQPVNVDVHGLAGFAAYKSDGAWHEPVPAEGSYRVDAFGPYQFVFVCGDDQTFDVEELFADPADGDQRIDPLAETAACEPALEGELGTLAGQVAQAGTVEIGAVGTEGFAPGWSYSLDLPQGRHDLVFRPSSALTPVLRRDLEVGPGVNVQPAIDATSEGVALERHPVELEALPDMAQVDTVATVITANGEHLDVGVANGVSAMLPAGSLRPGDRQVLAIRVLEDPFTEDDIVLDRTDNTAPLSAAVRPLPEVAYATTGTATAVTWRDVPLTPTSYELLISNPGTASVVHGRATSTVASGSLDLSIDADLTGFLAAWRPTWARDLDSSARTFHVLSPLATGCYEVELTDLGRSTHGGMIGTRCPLLR